LLQSPRADFSQVNFDIKNAVDGSPNGGKGWAVSPSLGVVHWATFEIQQPVGEAEGTVLTAVLSHQFNPGFLPGRFRLSVTRAPPPVGLDLAEDLRAILAVAPEVRPPAQRAALLGYFRAVDPEALRRARELDQARAPAPIDPKLKELRDAVAYASKPLPPDP